MILSSLLSSSKYIIVNKDLIKILGLHEAVILGELCSEYSYWESVNQLVDKEYFYSTRENIEKNTGINAHFQRVAMKNLEEKDILISKRMGIPCKKYYKINEFKVIEYLKKAKIIIDSPDVHEVNDKDDTTSTPKTSSDNLQDENPVDINNNNINNNKEHTHEQPTIEKTVEEKIEYDKLVTMTEKEHQDLINTYGEEMTHQLIEQLSLYKQAKGKNYDNDYAAILRWVTVRLHEMEKEKAKYDDFKNKKNNKSSNRLASFNQRDYPPDFFDNLYAN